MAKGKGEAQVVFELDADGHLREAIKALQDAAWHLRVASYGLEEEYARVPSATYRPMELGACVAVTEALGVQVDAIASQTRKIRKRAHDI
jgi:hypothetical protein